MTSNENLNQQTNKPTTQPTNPHTAQHATSEHTHVHLASAHHATVHHATVSQTAVHHATTHRPVHAKPPVAPSGTGSVAPASGAPVSAVTLIPELQRAIVELGFTTLTPIQEKAIPQIQKGHDIIGQAHTGSGKTAAFGFPLLEKITRDGGLQGLILVPTRELCVQVGKELKKFSKHRPVSIVEVYGGVDINPQMRNLRAAHVVVGTPGRVLDHLARRTVDFSKIKILVLDEADKMFDMGFIDDIRKIISQTPKTRQTLLFSATLSKEILGITHQYLRNPITITTQSHVDTSKLQQYYYVVEQNDKFSLMVHCLKDIKIPNKKTIIFGSTRDVVDIVTANLQQQNFAAASLHGGMTQNARSKVMEAFHANKVDVLVASDVAARGIDIKGITLVINYDIPQNSKEYTHRIGRTARAGEEGAVISLVTHRDFDNFRRVQEDRSIRPQKMVLPQFAHVQFFIPKREPRQNSGRRPQSSFRDSGSRGSTGGSYRGSSGGGFSSGRSSSGSGDRSGRSGDSRGGAGRSRSERSSRPRFGQ